PTPTNPASERCRNPRRDRFPRSSSIVDAPGGREVGGYLAMIVESVFAKSKEKTARRGRGRRRRATRPRGLTRLAEPAPPTAQKVALPLLPAARYNPTREIRSAPCRTAKEEQMRSSKQILASCAALVALVGMVSAQAPTDKRAATVNGEAIMQSEVEAVMKASQPPSPVPMTEAQKKELQANVVNMLIEDLLMRQYLKKNAPPANPTEVDKRVQEFAA